MSHDSPPTQPRRKPSLGQVVLSVLAAAIGVQKKANLEQDFAQSSPLPYIIAGIVFTVAFVATLIMVVKFVLSSP